MSNADAHLEPEPSDKRALFSALGFAGVILIVALVIYIAYMPTRKAQNSTVDQQARLAIKQETLAAQAKSAASYDWVDKSKGIVRIPVSQAMELTVRELQAKQAAQ